MKKRKLATGEQFIPLSEIWIFLSSTEPIAMNATKSIVVSLTSLSKYDMKSVHHAQLQLHYLMSDVPLQCASSRNF